jgi:DNA-binding transcriptional regulator PaaX
MSQRLSELESKVWTYLQKSDAWLTPASVAKGVGASEKAVRKSLQSLTLKGLAQAGGHERRRAYRISPAGRQRPKT